MKYYSELTKKFYESEEACSQAEKDYTSAQEETRLATEAKRMKRKEKAQEIEAMMKERDELNKRINKEIREFTKAYGAFHYSTEGEVDSHSLIDLFDWLWF